MEKKWYIIIGIGVLVLGGLIIMKSETLSIQSFNPFNLGGVVAQSSAYPEDERQIGYELLNNNSVVHVWNTQDNYYFNASSGIQFTNYYDEYWTQNIFCGGNTVTNQWICLDGLPDWDWSIITDNSTYVNYMGSKEFPGLPGVLISINYNLELDDNNLSINLGVDNGDGKKKIDNVGFIWKVKDIEIGGDSGGDIIYINDSFDYQGETEFDLSSITDELIFTNMIQSTYRLFDNNGFIKVDWNNSIPYEVNISNKINPEVILKLDIGTISKGDSFDTTIYWRDPITNGSSGATGITFSLQDGMTWNYDFPCGDDMELIVGIAVDSEPTATVSGITYDGTGLSLVGRQNDEYDDEEQVEMWNLSSPSCGSSLPIVVAWDGATKEEAAGGSMIFYGVDSINMSSVNTSYCNAASCSSSSLIVQAGPDDIVVDVIAVDVDTLGLGSGEGPQTELVNYDAGVDSIGISKGNSSDGAVTMGWVWANDEYATIGVALKPVVTPTINLDIITPVNFNHLNVTQNEFFNVSVNVTCLNTNCGEINVSLDPLEVGVNVGFVTEAPISDPTGGASATFDTFARTFRDTTPLGGGNIVEIGVWVNAYAGPTEEADIDLAIYTNNGGTNEPEDIVGKETVAKGTDENVWVRTTNLNIPVSGDTLYWIAAQLDDTATRTDLDYRNIGGEKGDYKAPQTELTDPWGTSDGTAERIYSIYALYQVGKGLISTEIGATPFYTNNSVNPQNITLDVNESIILTFWVNATGPVSNNNHTFFVYANRTSNFGISNISGKWNVSIAPSTGVSDEDTPLFSSYWDNNGSLIDSGDGFFNTTLLSTNGTVFLEIDGNNLTATNGTAGDWTVYNATPVFSSGGVYPYYWHSWGNGTNENYNNSGVRSYTVNSSSSCTYGGSGNWEVDCSDDCTVSSNVVGDGSNLIASGSGLFLMNANVSGFNRYLFTDNCKAVCDGGCILV